MGLRAAYEQTDQQQDKHGGTPLDPGSADAGLRLVCFENNSIRGFPFFIHRNTSTGLCPKADSHGVPSLALFPSACTVSNKKTQAADNVKILITPVMRPPFSASSR